MSDSGKLLSNKKSILIMLIASIFPVLFYAAGVIVNNEDLHISTFVSSVLLGYLSSVCLTFFISVSVDYTISVFQRILPWNKHPFKRLIFELITISVVAAIIMTVWMFLINWLIELPDDYKTPQFWYRGIVIALVMTIILTSMHEGFYFFKQWKQSIVREEQLEKESIRSQYEALKQQMNPHFLFNSLNVLSSIVHKDSNLAEHFIDEFANVYRYILEVNKEHLVSIQREIDVTNSYLYLQKIRFPSGFEVAMKIDESFYNYSIPPLTIQTVIENALKHNMHSETSPLRITIKTKEDCLEIKNNILPKKQYGNSTSIGQKNIIEKYSLLTFEKLPQFYATDTHYIALIPIRK